MRSWSTSARPARRAVAALCLGLIVIGCAAEVSDPRITATSTPEAFPTTATPSQPASPSASAGQDGPSSSAAASSPAASSPPPLLPGAATDAPIPAPEVLAAQLDPLLQVPQGVVGTAVVDVQTGELLYGLDEEEPLIPASTVKILTATAALSVLGADHTYVTSTSAVPRSAETTVVLDAGGDVLMGTESSDEDDVLGRAGLGTLAQQTVKALQERDLAGPVTVHLDDTGYSGPALSPQWHERVIHVDVSPVTPIATYGGRRIGEGWGQRVPDPAMHAAQVFRQQLLAHARSQDVAITVSPTITRGAPPQSASAVQLAEVRSATVAEQVQFMLHESDNLTAEAMARNTALAAGHPGSFTGGAAAVREVLEAETQDLSGLELTDGSGLSGYTTITAEQLARAVRLAGRSEQTVAAVQGLPLAGREGTLENRMAGTAAEGRARGKTGTLGSVATLAGVVVTADGRELAYSILTNGQRGRLPQARTMIDRAVVTLAECGCRAD